MSKAPLAAIAGIGWTDYSRNSGRTVEALALEACSRAIADAGLDPARVDGLVSFSLGDSVPTSVVATDLGLGGLNHYADFAAGGFMACGLVLEAAMAVASGQADYVVAYRALNGASGQRYGGASFSKLLSDFGVHTDAEQQFLDTAGITMPAQEFALLCRRHMQRYGTTSDDLGAVAVAQRQWAQDNPRAQMRNRPMTLDDYYRSPWVAEPFHVLDCCLQSDGGGMYSLQALWTQARERLDVINIVFANRQYKILQGELLAVGAQPGRWSQELFDLSRPDLDWVKLSGGMGVEATRVDTLEAFADVFRSAAARRGPFLIEFII